MGTHRSKELESSFLRIKEGLRCLHLALLIIMHSKNKSGRKVMAQVFNDSSAQACDAQKVLEAILSNIEDIRSSEIQMGPRCLRGECLPGREDSSERVIEWINSVFFHFKCLTVNNSRLKTRFFAGKSERMVDDADKIEKKAQKLIEKKERKQNEDKRVLKNIDERIQKIKVEICENLNAESANHYITNRLADALKRLEKIRNELLKSLGKSLDDDTSDQPGNQKETSTSPQNSTASSMGSSPSSSVPYQGNRKEQEDKDLFVTEDIHTKKGEDEKSKEIYGEELCVEDIIIKKIHPTIQGLECNPSTGESGPVFTLDSMTKIFDTLWVSFTKMKKGICESITVKDSFGNAFAINIASCREVEGRDDDDNITASLNSDIRLKPDTPEKEAEKMSLNTTGYSPALMSIMTVICGVLVLSPTEFLGLPSRLYGMRPCFVRSHISEALLVRLAVDYIIMHLAKSRIADFMRLQCGTLGLCKQQIIELINGFGRTLGALAQHTRKILLSESETVHNDDTYMRCIELQRDEDGNLVRQNCHLWGMVTGAHEKKQGAIYLASRSRDTESFLRQFGLSGDDAGPQTIFPCAIKNLITDCCPVYHPGVAKLEELSGHTIRRAGCYAHLRRYFIDALRTMNLLDIFEVVNPKRIPGFEERLDAILAESERQIGTSARNVLRACRLIEIIFCFEEDFAYRTRQEMEERRQEYTRRYVDNLYATVDALKAATPTIEEKQDRNGVVQYKGGADVPWGAAVVYALNNKAELLAFLTCGDIECSNNRAERILRSSKFHSRSMEFLNTESGFHAFADLMTLITTCRVNNVNPYTYMHWAFANAKIRLEDYRLAVSKATHTTAQMCWLPTPYKKDDRVIGLYDPEFETFFDEVDWTGLDVWSFMKLLDEEAPRKKPEKRESRPKDSDG